MKQSNNVIICGASGALGDQLVFRQRAGKTVISLPPVQKAYSPSTDQPEIRNKFVEASRYARTALANTTLKAAYQAKFPEGTNAYNTAIADFFRAPMIVFVDTTNYTGAFYTGALGDPILIQAVDDLKVNLVYVTIQDVDGNVREEGAAIAGGSDLWTYTATALNAIPAGGKVIVKASDLPGNLTTRETGL